jgi:hypothetical protein
MTRVLAVYNRWASFVCEQSQSASLFVPAVSFPDFVFAFPGLFFWVLLFLESLNPSVLTTLAFTESRSFRSFCTIVMASLLPSIPYPPSQEGYWSPVTSTLNWCEEVRHTIP